MSMALGPLFPMQVIVPTEAYVALPLVAVIIGLVASASGLHRACPSIPRWHSEVRSGRSQHPGPGRRILQRRARGPADLQPQSRRGSGVIGDPAGPQRLR